MKPADGRTAEFCKSGMTEDERCHFLFNFDTHKFLGLLFVTNFDPVTAAWIDA
jgi:hypothetical protein